MISVDGNVDLIPNLMPRIDRAQVEAAIEDFIRCCEQEEVDRAEFLRTYEQLMGLKFYLNDEQCQLVNSIYAREETQVSAVNSIRFIQPPIESDTEMDESIFL